MNAAISCKKKSWQLAGRKSQEVYLGVELKICSGMFGRNVPRYLRGVTVQWWCVERITAA